MEISVTTAERSTQKKTAATMTKPNSTERALADSVLSQSWRAD
jgi:hypothetical protein